jgi:hypothetical protein
MDISRSCKIRELNWALLPDLVERLKREGWEVKEVRVEIHRYPDVLEFDSIEDACLNVRKQGIPDHFTIRLGGGGLSRPRLRISRDWNIHREEFLYLDMEKIDDVSKLDAVMEFLGLESDEPSTLPPRPPRTAFLAHKFDLTGTDAADKVARFLELLGFRVVTGRAYAPGSVAAKVRNRIEEQAILFVILTPGADDTWLTQESVIASVKGKPIFVLKEQSAEFKPGILADHEYIPFELSKIETVFIRLLEGLRELGYLDFTD